MSTFLLVYGNKQYALRIYTHADVRLSRTEGAIMHPMHKMHKRAEQKKRGKSLAGNRLGRELCKTEKNRGMHAWPRGEANWDERGGQCVRTTWRFVWPLTGASGPDGSADMPVMRSGGSGRYDVRANRGGVRSWKEWMRSAGRGFEKKSRVLLVSQGLLAATASAPARSIEDIVHV
jgi:hypothetical protein